MSAPKLSPLENQVRAARATGYGAICLRREGDYCTVEIQNGEYWIEVIREAIDGNFSHIVEPLGIEEAIFHPKILRPMGGR